MGVIGLSLPSEPISVELVWNRGKMRVDEKNIFLIDGLGALVSVFFLGVALPALEEIIGMPTHILYLLTVAPALFFGFDMYCFLYPRRANEKGLLAIIGANAIYCLVSSGVVIQHFDLLTGWGLLYFLGEILTLIALIVFEARVFRAAYRSSAGSSSSSNPSVDL